MGANRYDGPRPYLPPLCAEFRDALNAEIIAVRRANDRNALVLRNGKQVGQVGRQFLYRFALENAFQMPSDVPGTIEVPQFQPVAATVLQLEGLAILLSAAADFGDFVPFARLSTDLSQLLVRLIERIEEYGGEPNPTGDRVLGLAPVTGKIFEGKIQEIEDGHQAAAVRSALGRDVTYIWGPPGTGKTFTIGQIGAELIRQGRSLLLVSHTNTAVDQAVIQIRQGLTDGEFEDGSILRVGQPVERRLREDPKFQRLLLETHVRERMEQLAARRDSLVAEHEAKVNTLASLANELELLEWLLVAEEDVSSMERSMDALREVERSVRAENVVIEEMASREDEVRQSLEDANAADAAIAQRDSLSDELVRSRETLSRAQNDLSALEEKLGEAERILAATEAANPLVRRWRRLPTPGVQRINVKEISERVSGARDDLLACAQRLTAGERELDRTLQTLRRFELDHNVSASAVREAAKVFLKRLDSAKADFAVSEAAARRQRRELEHELEGHMATLEAWGHVSGTFYGVEQSLPEVERVIAALRAQAPTTPIDTLRGSYQSLNDAIAEIEDEIDSLDAQMKTVEDDLIKKAGVVATTLTRAYLRDPIQEREFDTVVLDEASMAPMPALWIVARLATHAVVVGDYKQLPPICQATNSAVVEKWLATDVFERAGLLNAHRRHPVGFESLLTQRRMHPQISQIVNELVYEGELSDHASTLDEAAPSWLDTAWEHDTPVLLVDMEPLHAWVTSVASGARASRLNFLSACVSVDIASQMLGEARPPVEDGKARILLISPYQPHARLTREMLEVEGLRGELSAGTAHFFQGSEADAVVLDLVNDEPHWRVGIFDQRRDDATLRLLNVAITRARRRLIVVADFAWIRRNTKATAFLRRLIDFLIERYPLIDASRVLRPSLVAAVSPASSILYGRLDVVSGDQTVVTHTDFFTLFLADLQNAAKRVVIFSPFMTMQRVTFLEAALRSAILRGVRLYVVTKSLEDRGIRERPEYARIETVLAGWGVTVVHKRHMHEKLVFIDRGLLWAGSLNALSHSSTQEIMERRESAQVSELYARLLCLEDLLSAYDDDETRCPICGSEVVASEGSEEPFYWRCVVEGCYSRSIGSAMPRDGVIICASGKCGSRLVFGDPTGVA
jgi:uncharacterized coiled-coil protein SlyX